MINILYLYNTDGPIFISPSTVNVVWIPKKKFPVRGGTGYIIELAMGRFTASAIKYEPLIGHILYYFPKSNYYAILSAYNPAQLIIYPVFNSLLVYNLNNIKLSKFPT